MLNVPKEYSDIVNEAVKISGILLNSDELLSHIHYDGEIRLYDMFNHISMADLYHDLSNMSADFDGTIDIIENNQGQEYDRSKLHLYPVVFARSVIWLYLNPTFNGELSQKTIDFIRKTFQARCSEIRIVREYSYHVLKYYTDTELFLEKVRTLFGSDFGKIEGYGDFRDSCSGFRDNDNDVNVIGDDGYSEFVDNFWRNVNINFVNQITVFYEGNADDIIAFFNSDRKRFIYSGGKVTVVQRPFTIPLNVLKDKIIGEHPDTEELYAQDEVWMFLIACGLLTVEDVFAMFDIINPKHLTDEICRSQKYGKYTDIKIIADFKKNGRNTTVTIVLGEQKRVVKFSYANIMMMHQYHTEWCPNDIALLRKHITRPITEMILVHKSFRQANDGKPYLVIVHKKGKNGGLTKQSVIFSSDITYPEIPLNDGTFNNWRMLVEMKDYIQKLHYHHLVKIMIKEKRNALLCLLRMEWLIGSHDLSKIIVGYM